MSAGPNTQSFVSEVVGVGKFLPPRIVKNEELRDLMDTSDEWIRQRTGIEQRHWVNPNDAKMSSTAALAHEASLLAIESASKARDFKKEDIDLIVFATLSPDHLFPGSACFLQQKLGLPEIPALDVRQQCSGFLYALSVADQFIKTGQSKNVLVVGSEVHSVGLDKTPRGRDVSVLFGDGAGAVILTRKAFEETDADSSKESRILSTHLHADGRFAKELWIESPGTGVEEPEWLTHEMMETGRVYPQMNGKTVFLHATKRMPEAIREAVESNGYTIDDVDCFIFHQANLRINEMVAKQLKIPSEKVFNTIQKYANTTAATIPIGICDALEVGKIKKGDLVACAAFGSGFTWASALIRW